MNRSTRLRRIADAELWQQHLVWQRSDLARVLCKSSEFGDHFYLSVRREDTAQHFAKTKAFGSTATACTTSKIHQQSSVASHHKRLRPTRGCGTNEESNARRLPSCTAKTHHQIFSRVAAKSWRCWLPCHNMTDKKIRKQLVPGLFYGFKSPDVRRGEFD